MLDRKVVKPDPPADLAFNLNSRRQFETQQLR
jgi:hypothetical protein